MAFDPSTEILPSLPTQHLGSGSPRPPITGSQQKTLLRYCCSVCCSCPSTWCWIQLESTHLARGSFSLTRSSCSHNLWCRAMFQTGRCDQPVPALSKATALSLPPTASTHFSRNPANYRLCHEALTLLTDPK